MTGLRFSGKRAWLLIVFISSACATGVRPPATRGPRADIVIRDVTVVDVEHRRFVPHQDLVIRGTDLVRVGPTSRLPPPARIVIDGRRRLALPGFVDAHTHLWQHAARGLEANSQLQEWLRIYRLVPYMTDDDVYWVTRAAAAQALTSGITSVVDYASLASRSGGFEATYRAIRDAHVGGALVWCHWSVFLPSHLRQRFARELRSRSDDRLAMWVGPGLLSFMDLPLVYDGIRTAQAAGLPITEHTMENAQEQRDLHRRLEAYLALHGAKLRPTDRSLLERTVRLPPPPAPDQEARIGRLHGALGRPSEPSISPVPVLEALGALDRGFLSIHSVWLDGADVATYARRRASVVYNPESNAYLASGVAPVLELTRAGVDVALGTDGAASNDGIDMFSAMRAGINAQKLETLDPTKSAAYGPWEALRSATVVGARAIGQGRRIGTLEPGKQADIVLLDMRRLGLAPFVPERQGAALLVYSASPRDVDTVIADGHIVVRDGELTDIAEGALAARLSWVSRRATERSEQGTDIVADEVFDRAPTSWHRYGPLQPSDSLDIRIRNAGTNPIRVTVAFSGGALAPMMLRDDTRARFPANPSDAFFERTTVLERGRTLRILKKRGSKSMSFRGVAPPVDRLVPGRGEQFMIVAERSP